MWFGSQSKDVSEQSYRLLLVMVNGDETCFFLNMKLPDQTDVNILRCVQLN
jgi:hypothetical protein